MSVAPVQLDGRTVACLGSGDESASLVDVATGDVLHTLAGHTDSVVASGFSQDGSMLATGGYEGVVRLWNPRTGAFLRSLEGPSQGIEWLSWHPTANVLAAGSGDGTAWMWLPATGTCMQVFAGHEESVSCGAFSGTGKVRGGHSHLGVRRDSVTLCRVRRRRRRRSCSSPAPRTARRAPGTPRRARSTTCSKGAWEVLCGEGVFARVAAWVLARAG